ncbi:MAG TPA: UDP-N-acetylmuramoyl-tripeptide--D-alanyl-D-alanine ligase [Candidatus Hydrogenedentes bacterium]|nr:UDP-N-acetylmuramoyl-tripeptide--D-alanyl-D-alanine ligase [Candidatus Hydrogenedentota bacterium]
MNWRYTASELARIVNAPAPARDAAFSGVSTDTRTLEPGQVFFALPGTNFDGNKFVAEAFAKGAAGVVSQIALADRPCVVVEDPLKALQVLAAHHRGRFSLPVIAITGSCGKTTAKDCISAVLGAKYRVIKTQGNFNNEIGCPLSLLQLDADTERAVIEMGANHLGEIAHLCRLARPTEAAITLVAPAHLEGFGSIENVAAAKAEIMEGLSPDGFFYVNADNAWCSEIGGRFSGGKCYFGHSGDVVVDRQEWDASGEMVVDIRPIGRLRLPLAVPAQIANVLLAVAVGLHHGVTEFEAPLRGALEHAARFRVSRIGVLEVLDDSYNANPASMAAALEALGARPGGGARIAALGDMLELGAAARRLHREIGEAAGRWGVKHLFAYGAHAHDMIEGALAAGVPHAEAVQDHAAIASAVHAVAHPGDSFLIKGSRGTRMETILPELRALYKEPAAENARH